MPEDFIEVIDRFDRLRRHSNTVTVKDSEGREIRQFRFYHGSYWWSDPNEKYEGYTQREASQKTKEVYLSLKNKIWPPFIDMEPWLDEDFVMDLVSRGEEDFREMVDCGDLKTEEGYAGYEWRITN